MVITIPVNVKYWYGSKKNSWFSHIFMEIPKEELSTGWCESISDEEYNNYNEK